MNVNEQRDKVEVWRCQYSGCYGSVGEVLRNKKGEVTWLKVGSGAKMSVGWSDKCPDCGRRSLWISPYRGVKRILHKRKKSVCDV